jgi:hypothetical protein
MIQNMYYITLINKRSTIIQIIHKLRRLAEWTWRSSMKWPTKHLVLHCSEYSMQDHKGRGYLLTSGSYITLQSKTMSPGQIFQRQLKDRMQTKRNRHTQTSKTRSSWQEAACLIHHDQH